MKGIILAGGAGTRLYPNTQIVNKQLLPVYDKPMIYYPLATLMLCGIREILIISTPKDLPHYQNILGNGMRLGLNIFYQVEEKPKGIAQAFAIGEEFIDRKPVCLILGDNVFYGNNLPKLLQKAGTLKSGALIFAYWVDEPGRFGVVEFNQEGKVLSLEEKPVRPKSNYIVPGLYFYDEKVVDLAKKLNPSPRGELEITDLNREYLKLGELNVQVMGRGIAWFDTGTPKSMLDAANYIAVIEKMQGEKIACIEEIAFAMGFISKFQFVQLINGLPKGSYQDYLLQLLAREN
ncbi:MAG: glucose-1-phosphate thymidylyltransferase RfbA [Bacillota bacterium]|jgi:glucose-1-phosphate thymidylyltransferase